MGDLQLLRPDPGCLERRDDLLHGLASAGNNHMLWTVDGGDGDLRCVGTTGGSDSDFLRKYCDHLPISRQSLHQTAPFCYQLEAIF